MHPSGPREIRPDWLRAIPAEPLAFAWEVYEDYALTQFIPGTPVNIEAQGDVVRWYEPVRDPDLIQSIIDLRGAENDGILGWVRLHGLLGARPRRLGIVWEGLDAFREQVDDLALAVHLLQRAKADRWRPDSVQPLASLLALKTMHHLRSSISLGIDAAGRSVITPVLFGKSPLGAAYQQLLELTRRFQDHGPRSGRAWRSPRPCGRCGRLFSPYHRTDQWCSPNCRKRAADARRHAER